MLILTAYSNIRIIQMKYSYDERRTHHKENTSIPFQTNDDRLWPKSLISADEQSNVWKDLAKQIMSRR